MHRAVGVAVGVVALGLLSLGPVALAQPPATETPAPGQGPGPARPTPVPSAPQGPVIPGQEKEKPAEEERQIAPTGPGAPVNLQRVPEELLPRSTPFVGPDLFNPPAQQGWLTITPTITLSGEYNDNIFVSSIDKRSDGIISFTPGFTVGVQRPSYRLVGGYNISGQLYFNETDLNDFGKEQQAYVDYSYEISPRVRFTLGDQFRYSRQSNGVTAGGVSVGLEDSLRNTITPQLQFQLSQRTSLDLLASWTILRFTSATSGNTSTGNVDSDTYRVGVGLGHQLTQRLRAEAGVGVAYLDAKGEPGARVYTPTVSLSYAVTPTLSATISGGPSIFEQKGDISVTPAIGAGIVQLFKFGSIALGYDRAVTAETIGATDRQTFFGSVLVPTLWRAFTMSFTPRYTIADTDIGRGTSTQQGTVKSLSLNLGATYQIARSISLIGSYTFFHQTDDRSNNSDIDQNRVFLGLQYAFPINFY
jgi:hypothetical protein